MTTEPTSGFRPCLFALLCCCFWGPATATAQTPQKPLSRSEILGRLAIHDSPSNIAHEIKLRGIDFTADSSYLSLISLAGGRGILYERIASTEPSPQTVSADSDPAYRLLAKCAEYIHVGASEQAEAACRAAIEDEPKSSWPYMALLASRGEEIPAEDRLDFARRAVAADPESVLAHQLLVSSLPEGEEKTAEVQRLLPLLAKQPASEHYISNHYLSYSAPSGVRDNSRQEFEKTVAKALEDAGDLANTHLQIAEALLNRGETSRSIAQMQEAVRLEPDNSYIHLAYAEMYSRAEDHDSEVAELHEAVRVEPQALSPRTVLAQHLTTLGRQAEAIAEMKELIAIRPKDSDSSNRLVNMYEESKDRPSAIAELRRHLKATASAAKTTDPAAYADRQAEYLRLASLLYESRDYDLANEVYLDLLASDPDNYGIHNDYGIVLLAQNKIPEASEQFNVALRIEPNMPEAHNNLGLCLMRTNKLDSAISEYQRALDLDPESPNTRTSLGAAMGMKGDVDGAMAQFREMIEKNPGDALAHLNLGHALELKKDFSQAIQELKKSVELDAEMPAAQNDLAWLYATSTNQRDRNPQEALIHARRAVELLAQHPNTPPQETAAFLDTLAEALLINGHAREALPYEEKALALDPNNAEFKTRIEGFRAVAANGAADKPQTPAARQ